MKGAIEALGVASEVQELAASTRTAQEAAAALGCQVAQIVKSLVFRGVTSGKPLLALVAGANRASEPRLAEHFGEPTERADADFVRARTGFAIGGVAPVGHPEPIDVIIDRDLMDFARLWAAAGSPFAVFSITPRSFSGSPGAGWWT